MGSVAKESQLHLDGLPNKSRRRTLPPTLHNAAETPRHPILKSALSTPEDSTSPLRRMSNSFEAEHPTTIKRRTSKLGLFGLFNRSKITLDIETPQENLETGWHGIVSTERPITRDGQAAYIPPETDAEPPIPKISEASLRRRSSKSALRSKASFKKDAKALATWSPPPLFQAFPQAVKHATLRAPSISADTILRNHKEKSAREEQGANGASVATLGSVEDPKSEQKEKRLKKTMTDLASHGGWTDKIYVLVTSGYLLQYAGTGVFDRLPEKILPLTENTAAFASDVIPGKHFVLQISQVSSEDGTVNVEISRTMFKKLGLRNEIKRSASSFLLVLENPEEMDEWLVVVRREIEALGGQEYKPDVLHSKMAVDPLPTGTLQRLPSQRYLVKRDPYAFSQTRTDDVKQQAQIPESSIQERNVGLDPSLTASGPNRHSTTTHFSSDSRYISDTHNSIDQVHLDRLRESFASTGKGTTSTSRDSSPDPSRAQRLSDRHAAATSTAMSDDFSLFEPFFESPQDTLSNNVDRESLQPTPTPYSRPTSLLPVSPSRTTSPPNFSVPTFSKRFSVASGSSGPSIKPNGPQRNSPGAPSPREKEATEEIASSANRASTVGNLRMSPQPSLAALNRLSASQPSSRLGTPPTTSHSHDHAADGDRHYSRRFSSLEYARGVSPVKLSGHSPSPHPPPTCPLPPIPSSVEPSKRPPVIPAPAAISTPPMAPTNTNKVPDVPVAKRSSQSSDRAPMSLVGTPDSEERNLSVSSDVGLPLQKHPITPSTETSPQSSPDPTSTSGTSPVLEEPSSAASADKPELPVLSNKNALEKPRGLRRPGSSQAQPVPPSPIKSPIETVIDEQAPPSLTNPELPSPPRPTRAAPVPPPLRQIPIPPIPKSRPPPSPKLQKRRSMPRLGRDSSPGISSPWKFGSKTKTTPNSPLPPQSGASQEHSSASNQKSPQSLTSFQLPTPFIPAIDVSGRKSRSSLDGPWNLGYTNSPTGRTFLDLSVG